MDGARYSESAVVWLDMSSLHGVAGRGGYSPGASRQAVQDAHHVTPDHLYGLLGGAFNTSSIVEGSAKTGKAWPIVREAIPALPVALRSMVFEREVLIAGTRLWNQWHFYQTSEIQLGAWVSAWVKWAERPVLGGVSQIGHGQADVDYTLSGEPFLSVVDGKVTLAAPALTALNAYCTHIDARKDAISTFLLAVESNAAESTVVVHAGNLQNDLLAQEMD